MVLTEQEFYQKCNEIDEEDNWSVLPLIIVAIFGLVIGFVIGVFAGCL